MIAGEMELVVFSGIQASGQSTLFKARFVFKAPFDVGFRDLMVATCRRLLCGDAFVMAEAGLKPELSGGST